MKALIHIYWLILAMHTHGHARRKLDVWKQLLGESVYLPFVHASRNREDDLLDSAIYF